MDFKQIQELIRQAVKAELSELKIEQGDFKISIKTKSAHTQQAYILPPAQEVIPSAPRQENAAPSPPLPTEKKAAEAHDITENNPNVITVTSPMIGTFYRAPSPDKPPFVKVGDKVEKGNVLCVIEAMKLFNEIESEYSGTIIKFLVDDASPVEYDQPLFLIEKA